ncbi:conserved hypothetical protein [Neospora caninum Liverpool]|uniref:Uncharacterized protein n=1 Tax=Neospora caninum (strain Liverpool) TaxID=572307 RepID=F0VDA2_NEOCL|nr:conserved hypothetical protein [Neospora caninum Liverpool]CBZ51617.1 conserved hypothetical protein [Neospora caninum Liverpool]|eukprot:XP_003881650.1 conserved hypothetical protein [Neospora caninum Liverpool]
MRSGINGGSWSETGALSEDGGRTGAGNDAAAYVASRHASASDNVPRRASQFLAGGRHQQKVTECGDESAGAKNAARLEAHVKQRDRLASATAAATFWSSHRGNAQCQYTRVCEEDTSSVPPFPRSWATAASTSDACGIPATGEPEPSAHQTAPSSAPEGRGLNACTGFLEETEQRCCACAVPEAASSPGGAFPTGAGVREASRLRQLLATCGLRPGQTENGKPRGITVDDVRLRESERHVNNCRDSESESSWEDVAEEAWKAARPTFPVGGKDTALPKRASRDAAGPEATRSAGDQSCRTASEIRNQGGLSAARMCRATSQVTPVDVEEQLVPVTRNGVGALLWRRPPSTVTTPTAGRFIPRLTAAAFADPGRDVSAFSESSLEQFESVVSDIFLTTRALVLPHSSAPRSAAASSASRLALPGPLRLQSELTSDPSITAEKHGAVWPLTSCHAPAAKGGLGEDDRARPPIPASGMLALEQELLFLSASASGKQRLNSRRVRRLNRPRAARGRSDETRSATGRWRGESWNCTPLEPGEGGEGFSQGAIGVENSHGATGKTPSPGGLLEMRPCATLNNRRKTSEDSATGYTEITCSYTWRNAKPNLQVSGTGTDSSSLGSLDSDSSSSRGTSDSAGSDIREEAQRRESLPPVWPGRLEGTKERGDECPVEGRHADDELEEERGRSSMSRCRVRGKTREVERHRTDGSHSTGVEASRIRDAAGGQVSSMPSIMRGALLTSSPRRGYRPPVGWPAGKCGDPSFVGHSGRSAVCRQRRSSDGDAMALGRLRKQCLKTKTRERARSASDGKVASRSAINKGERENWETVSGPEALGQLKEPENLDNPLQSDGVKEMRMHLSQELNPQRTVCGEESAPINPVRLVDPEEAPAHLSGHWPPGRMQGRSSGGVSSRDSRHTPNLKRSPVPCGQQNRGEGKRTYGQEHADLSTVQKPTSGQMWFYSDHFFYDFF